MGFFSSLKKALSFSGKSTKRHRGRKSRGTRRHRRRGGDKAGGKSVKRGGDYV
jgi:hypothetical protein